MALGFHYFDSRTGGNSVQLNIGLYVRTDAGWNFAGPVQGLFGSEPRDASFPAGRIEITTVTLGPGDARCCPSEEARWSVDTATRAVTRLR